MCCSNVPLITDWWMVIITAVYMIATIAIFVANLVSAKSAKQQLAEMKNQFDINDSPSIEVEFHHFGEDFIGIRVVNHGKHTAQKVRVIFSEEFLAGVERIEDGFLKPYILSLKDKECVLGVEQYTDLFVAINSEIKDLKEKPPICGKVYYTFRNKSFFTPFYFDLDNYLSAFHVTCHEDEIKLSLDNTTLQLKGLKHHEIMKSFHNGMHE